MGKPGLDEKIRLLSGADMWRSHALPDANIPAIKMTDGPNGARGDMAKRVPAACFPVGVALGATFNAALMRRVGEALGEETLSKAADVLLGPTINIQRTPIGGRNFECLSEDPWLTGHLATELVRGIQSKGVGACPKHYVANDTEVDRHHISSNIEERVLREIYLLPFEMVVTEARPWMIMAAYNRINGVYGCSHDALLNGVLRGEWGFDGVVVSDWGAATDTVRDALGGLDLEMPGPSKVWGQKLKAAIDAGHVPESAVDAKVERITRIARRRGKVAGGNEPPEEGIDRPEHRALIREAGAEGTVMLKNDGVLPFNPAAIKRLAVIGPNAREGQVMGGGSSTVRSHPVVHPLAGIKAGFGPGTEVIFEPGCLTHKYLPLIDPARLRDQAGGPGFTMARYRADTFEGTPEDIRPLRTSMFSVFDALSNIATAGPFSLVLTGTYTPEEDGEFEISLMSAGLSRLYADGRLVVDNWDQWRRGDSFFTYGSQEQRGRISLRRDQPVALRVEFRRDGAAPIAAVRVGLLAPQPGDLMARAVKAAAEADAVVLVVGTNADWESEGADRAGMALPGDQDELVARVMAANPNCAVVVNAGSPVTMPWYDSAKAVLVPWFAGEEMGHALADVLTGKADPGGRLPLTWPRRLEDTPAFTSYPGDNHEMNYGEGHFVGYRWYDRRKIMPLAPFGHGLSYGDFTIGPMTLPARAAAGEPVRVSMTVTNNGAHAGRAVIQLYVGEAKPKRIRADKELKGVAKLTLAPGQSEEVTITLAPRAFMAWDIAAQAFSAEPGDFTIQAGLSAGDIRQSATLTLSE